MSQPGNPSPPKKSKHIKLRCNACNQGFMVHSNEDGTWKLKQPCVHIIIEGVFEDVPK